jgi:hypothetical protein
LRERGRAAGSQAVRVGGEPVRSIDLRYLERWAAGRRKPTLRQIGVDEIHLGKKQKFLTVASTLKSGEPLWFGRERKNETLDEFLQQGVERPATERHPGGVRRHVGALPVKHRAMGTAVSHRVRQFPHHAARHPCRGRRAAGGVFPQSWADARIGERETLAGADVFLVLAHDRRRILHFALTAHGTCGMDRAAIAGGVSVEERAAFLTAGPRPHLRF